MNTKEIACPTFTLAIMGPNEERVMDFLRDVHEQAKRQNMLLFQIHTKDGQAVMDGFRAQVKHDGGKVPFYTKEVKS